MIYYLFGILRVSERSTCYNIYMAKYTGYICYRKGCFSQCKVVCLVLLIIWMSKFKNLCENYACLKYSKSHSSASATDETYVETIYLVITLSLNDMNRWWLIMIYVYFINNKSKYNRLNSGNYYVGSACIYQM